MYISEIFQSIDGEVNRWGQGHITTFIRLAGCNLRCSYCDTKYAQTTTGSKIMGVEEILKEVHTPKVTITGGEPLLQKEELKELIKQLKLMSRNSQKISIETNGSIEIPDWYCDLNWIVDYKLPSSKMFSSMSQRSYMNLKETDYIKFVIYNQSDFKFAREIKKYLQEHLYVRAKFAFSPCVGKLDEETLLDWMLGFGLYDAILNIQIHKKIGLK